MSSLTVRERAGAVPNAAGAGWAQASCPRTLDALLRLDCADGAPCAKCTDERGFPPGNTYALVSPPCVAPFAYADSSDRVSATTGTRSGALGAGSYNFLLPIVGVRCTTAGSSTSRGCSASGSRFCTYGLYKAPEATVWWFGRFPLYVVPCGFARGGEGGRSTRYDLNGEVLAGTFSIPCAGHVGGSTSCTDDVGLYRCPAARLATDPRAAACMWSSSVDCPCTGGRSWRRGCAALYKAPLASSRYVNGCGWGPADNLRPSPEDWELEAEYEREYECEDRRLAIGPLSCTIAIAVAAGWLTGWMGRVSE